MTRERWPKYFVVTDADRETLVVAKQLRDTLDETLTYSAAAGLPRASLLDDVLFLGDILSAAISLVQLPRLFFGKYCITHCYPYWTTRQLFKSRQAFELPDDELVRRTIERALELDEKIRLLNKLDVTSP